MMDDPLPRPPHTPSAAPQPRLRDEWRLRSARPTCAPPVCGPRKRWRRGHPPVAKRQRGAEPGSRTPFVRSGSDPVHAIPRTRRERPLHSSGRPGDPGVGAQHRRGQLTRCGPGVAFSVSSRFDVVLFEAIDTLNDPAPRPKFSEPALLTSSFPPIVVCWSSEVTVCIRFEIVAAVGAHFVSVL